jgi:hypothetical protein
MVIGKLKGRKHLGNMDVQWRTMLFNLEGKTVCEHGNENFAQPAFPYDERPYFTELADTNTLLLISIIEVIYRKPYRHQLI